MRLQSPKIKVFSIGSAVLLAGLIWILNSKKPEGEPTTPSDHVKVMQEVTENKADETPKIDQVTEQAPEEEKSTEELMNYVSEDRAPKTLKTHQPKREIVNHPRLGVVVRFTYEGNEHRYEPLGAEDHPDEAIPVEK